MKGAKQVEVSTLRLIQAAIKDRDIAARSKGVDDGISDEEILQVTADHGASATSSIEMYTKGNRGERGEREAQGSRHPGVHAAPAR